MRKCPKCGARMRRVHRTLMERLSYLAIYECKECHAEDNLPRAHHLHRGRAARCPKCGTFRIVRLKEPDRIDPMHTGLLNMIERVANGKLYHCRYCRIQFWDRRRLATEIAAEGAAEDAAAAQAAASQETEAAQSTGDGSDA